MPAWLGYVLKFVLDWGLNKIKPLVEKFINRTRIDIEVNKEQKEINSKDDLIEKWVKENPGQPLPPELEDHLRAGAGRRINGLQ